MHARRFWQSMLTVTAATLFIGQQILAKTAVAQAQENPNYITILQPPYPPVYPAKWLGYQQPNAAESITIHPDAISACKGYESQFKSAVYDNVVYTRKFKEPPELFFKPSGEVFMASCLIKRSPEGDEYTLEVDVACPIVPLNNPQRYIYTGGTKGVCRLSALTKFENEDKVPNWCTGSPDKFTVNNQIVDFSPGCLNHDICYWTIAPLGVNGKPINTKPVCDKNFYTDLKSICDKNFVNEITDPLKVSGRQKCYEMVKIYYTVVSETGRAKDGYTKAQNEANKVKTNLEQRFRIKIIGNKYDKDIAWELAYHQGIGETVPTSIVNAEITIAKSLTSSP